MIASIELSEMLIAILSLWEGGDGATSNMEYVRAQAETVGRILQNAGIQLDTGDLTDSFVKSINTVCAGNDLICEAQLLAEAIETRARVGQLTEPFKNLFNTISERLPNLSVNEILDVMFLVDMRACEDLGQSLTKVLWVKCEPGVRPGGCTVTEIMAAL